MNSEAHAVQPIAATPGKAIWTSLAIGMAVVDVVTASGWLKFIVLLHVAWFLKLIWTEKNG